MNKLILCRTATILCGLLAITFLTRPDTSTGHHDKLTGAALALISAIFGTQWGEYQKRQEATSTRLNKGSRLRRLFGGLPGMTVLTTNVQMNRPTVSDEQVNVGKSTH